MTMSGNIEDIERHLRAPATSFRELLLAGAKFAHAADVIDAMAAERVPDHTPLHRVGFNFTAGDLRKLRNALVAAGWKPDEAF